MPFVKGQSGNPDGRPKGARDKNGRIAKQTALSFIRLYFDSGEAKRDWQKMKPFERWQIICRLMSIVIPRETAARISLAGMPPAEAARLVLEAAGLLDEEE